MRSATSLALCLLGLSLNQCRADEFDFDEGDDGEFAFPSDPDFGKQGSVNSPPEPTEALESIPYEPTSTEGLHWVERFDEGWESRWKRSGHEKFGGKWTVRTRAKEALVGDTSLFTMNEAKHHGIASRFPRVNGNENQTFILSYEAKFEDSLTCGGAYIKLFDSSGLSDISQFNAETPYVIMFGPDKCGATNKVHFIYKIKNKKSGEWSEHHVTSPPPVLGDSHSHLYTLIIKPDDTFAIEVDGQEARAGNLIESFNPPLEPPTEMEDPDDVKPEDWVDQAEIPDPTATKPDDWDEEAPREIADPEAFMPKTWLENEPKYIADPEAEEPADWDQEEDGKWIAPTIPNPKCDDPAVAGCGEWKPSMIPNPEYKGKWSAPMMANPAYKGAWSRRMIPNPNYYKLESPHALYPVDAVGFELWTMQANLGFDNILISRSESAMRKFTEANWKKRFDIERSQEPAKPTSFPELNGGFLDKASMMSKILLAEYPVPVIGGGAAVLLLLFIILRRGKSKPTADQDAAVKKDDDKDAKKSEDSVEKESSSSRRGSKGEARQRPTKGKDGKGKESIPFPE